MVSHGITDKTMVVNFPAYNIITSNMMDGVSAEILVEPNMMVVDVGIKATLPQMRNRRSVVPRYTPEFQETVVEFAKNSRRSETSRTFNVPQQTVAEWTRKALRARDDKPDDGGNDSMRYTPEFRREVAEFALTNGRVVASRKYDVPKSTVGEWVMKALRARDDDIENIRSEATPVIVDNCVKASSMLDEATVVRYVSVIYREEESVMVETANIGAEIGSSEVTKVKKKNCSYGEKVDHQSSARNRTVSRTDKVIKGALVKDNCLNVLSPLLDKPVMNTVHRGRKVGHRLGKRRKKLLEKGFAQSNEVTNAVLAELTHPIIETVNTPPDSSTVFTSQLDSLPGYTGSVCEACGAVLAPDETLPEHLVAVHLTIEGLCDICGEDSEDFFAHFKIHLKNFFVRVDSPPMVTVKAELLENTDMNENIVKKEAIEEVKNCVDIKENIVKKEATEKAGRFVRNPYFSPS